MHRMRWPSLFICCGGDQLSPAGKYLSSCHSETSPNWSWESAFLSGRRTGPVIRVGAAAGLLLSQFPLRPLSNETLEGKGSPETIRFLSHLWALSVRTESAPSADLQTADRGGVVFCRIAVGGALRRHVASVPFHTRLHLHSGGLLHCVGAYPAAARVVGAHAEGAPGADPSTGDTVL